MPLPSHTVWHTINTDQVTSVYFTDCSVNYWKSLPLLVSQVPEKEASWNFYERSFLAKSDYWWYNHLGHVAKGDFTDQKINWWFLLLHEKYIRKWFYIHAKWFLNKSYDVRCSIHADHEASGYFIDWSLNYWKWLPFGISGPRHGMTLKLSPKKLLDKRLLLTMWVKWYSPFYKSENKFRIFVTAEE